MRLWAFLLLFILFAGAASGQEADYHYTDKQAWSVLTVDYSPAYLPASLQRDLLFRPLGNGFDGIWRCSFGKHLEFGPMFSHHYFVFNGASLADSMEKYGYHDVYMDYTREGFSITRFSLSLALVFPVKDWYFRGFGAFGGSYFSGVDATFGHAKTVKDSIVAVDGYLGKLSGLSYTFGIEAERSITESLSLHASAYYANYIEDKEHNALTLQYYQQYPHYTYTIPAYCLGLGICYRFYSRETKELPKSRIIKNGDSEEQ